MTWIIVFLALILIAIIRYSIVFENELRSVQNRLQKMNEDVKSIKLSVRRKEEWDEIRQEREEKKEKYYENPN